MSSDVNTAQPAAPSKGKPLKCMREIILGKVARPGGVSRAVLIDRVTQARRPEAAKVLDQMVGQGEVFRFVRPGGRGSVAVSYFASREDGLRWVDERDGKPVYVRKKPKAGTALAANKLAPVHEQHVGMGWRNLKPPKPEPAPVIVPAGVKRTVGPSFSYDSRFQCDPRERVIGGFASLGPGRYLDGAA